MKRILSLLLLTFALMANAQEWTDVTKFYFSNPNFSQGKLEPWFLFSGPSQKTDGAVAWKTGNYVLTYDVTSGLSAGHYRLTVYGYYRNGSANNDWTNYKSGSYSNVSANYVLYYSGAEHSFQIPCASSCARTEKLDDSDVKVGGTYYVPNSVNAAVKWFKEGYYTKVVEFDAADDEHLYVEPIVNTNNSAGLFVFGGIKLEYKGSLAFHKSITFEHSIVRIAPNAVVYNDFTISPEKVTLAKYEWVSTNPKVASVNANGEVTGLTEGEADIILKALDGSGVQGSYHVVVKSPVIANKNNIKISEVLVSNLDWVLDVSGNYGSWIELCNMTEDYVKLDGIYVTDDKTNLKKAAVKLKNDYLGNNNLIDPFGFRTIGFDHYDGVFAPDMIDFKLSYTGGTIYVTDGKAVIDSVAYPQAVARTSYVRDLNTDKWRSCAWPTMNSMLDVEKYSYLFGEERVPAPSFSEDGGFFTGTKNVTLHVPEGTIVSVTTDGSVPTRYNGTQYVVDTDFEIKTSVPFRAVAFKDGYLNSDVVTRTYILKDKRYVFPVISVVTDEPNFYGYDYGIFVAGGKYGRPGNGIETPRNWNADWDRPANFEYITADGEYVLSQEVDVSTCGGWSRAWEPHSFKLKANKYYMGLNTMDYAFFDSKPNIRHKALQIRNGGNDNVCRFVDPALQEIVRRSGLNVNTQAWQPCHIFINGKYQYVLNMREPNNKHYAYSNYGYDTDDIDQFEMSPDSGYVQKVGTPDAYNRWYELSASAADPAIYAEIDKLVDIDEFINYMAVEFFICNRDWPQNNVKAFRSVDDGKFHFVLFDLDLYEQLGGSPFTMFEQKRTYMFDNLRGDSRTPWKNGSRITAEIKLVPIFLNMLENDSFRRRFIDTYCVVAGSVFNPKFTKPILDEMRKYMNQGMSLTGESCDNSYNSIKNKYSQDNNNIKYSYLKSYSKMKIKKERTANLSTNIPEAKIFINDVEVPYGYYSGKVYDDVTISTSAPEGYKFLGWSMFSGGDITKGELSFTLTATSNRYVANWVKMDEAELAAVGQHQKPVVINEVSAANDVYVSDYFKKSDWIELYNTTDADINIAGMYVTDNIEMEQKFQIPVDNLTLNTIIPAHGFKVIWCDKKDIIGADIHTNFKLSDEEGSVMVTMYNGDAVAFSDTLTYVEHEGTQSFGRYPEAGLALFTMNKMTPGASNICQSDVFRYMTPDKFYTGIETIADMTSDSGIAISYVGNGVVNIKSDNTLKSVSVVALSGRTALQKTLNGTYATITIPASASGVYVVKVLDASGNSASHKIVIR